MEPSFPHLQASAVLLEEELGSFLDQAFDLEGVHPYREWAGVEMGVGIGSFLQEEGRLCSASQGHPCDQEYLVEALSPSVGNPFHPCLD